MTNRRDFLKNASLIAAAGVLSAGCNMQVAQSKSRKNFGLQIWSLGRELFEDVPGGLKRVADMGYSYLELASYNIEGRIRNVPLLEFKKYADDAGLKITSTHVEPPPMREFSRENFDSTMEFYKIACDQHAALEDCKHIIHIWPGQLTMRSTEDVAFVGELFNEAGKIAKGAGLTFGYHNYSGEFVRVVPGGTASLPVRGRAPEGAKIVYDAMIEATDPSLVEFQKDVYWTVMGQQDPVAYMKQYPDRIRLLHIKDVAVLGQSGMMNFQKIFETAYEIGITDFYVELENYREASLFDGVQACADYLNNAPFVK